MDDSSMQDRLRALQGVFLDFYGTVAAGDRHAVESVCQMVIDDHGLELTAFDLAHQWGHTYFAAIEALDGRGFRLLREIERDTLIETVAPLAGRIDADPYLAIFHQYMIQPPLFDEIREVLSWCRLPVCIVSNADEHELRAALAHHDLDFAEVISSERAQSYKPAPYIFQYALAQTGWSPDRTLHVGDSLHSDVGGARRSGLFAAWVRRAGRISDIGTEKPDFTWPDLRPLVLL